MRKNNKSNSMMKVKPLNSKQRDMMSAFNSGKQILSMGSSGSGKTFIAIYIALTHLHNHQDITICRSIVPTREIGFLKGTEKEKVEPYIAPYKAIFSQLFSDTSSYFRMVESKQVKFLPTTHIRGITLDNTILIIDEAQNMDKQELESIITRVGNNTRLIICGDFRQVDLSRHNERSGIGWLVNIVRHMKKHFKIVEFSTSDIVRSGFVKDFMIAVEKHGK